MKLRRGWAAAACVAAASLAGGVGSARADGNCGRRDDSGPTACAISGNGTYTGSLTPRHDPYPFQNEMDYFVFHAKAGTAFNVTLHDDSVPQCNAGTGYFAICGELQMTLINGRGEDIFETSSSATFQNGIAQVARIARTLHRAGTYYLVIGGTLNHIISGTYTGPDLLPVPYSFSVSGTPGVFWPPRCTVPRVRRHESLAAAKKNLAVDGCRVGRVARERSRGTRRGDLVGFGSRPGSTFPHGTRIRVVVAR